jgi:hypothetical protein
MVTAVFRHVAGSALQTNDSRRIQILRIPSSSNGSTGTHRQIPKGNFDFLPMYLLLLLLIAIVLIPHVTYILIGDGRASALT